MKTIFLFSFLLHSFFTFSQTNIDCEALLNKQIDIKLQDDRNIEKLNQNLLALANCGLEQNAIRVFIDEGRTDFALLRANTTKQEWEAITYQDLFTIILDFQKSESYIKEVKKQEIAAALSQRKVNLINWESDKILFQQLEVPQQFLTSFHTFLKANYNPEKTYQEMLNDFRTKDLQIKNKVQAKKEQDQRIVANKGYQDFTTLLEKARSEGKPLLLYFTCDVCKKSQKMQERILYNIEIQEKLITKFIFAALYVDDETELPDSEWEINKKTGVLINTVGAKYSKLQVDKFNNNFQPYLVMLSPSGEVIVEQGFVRDKEVFEKFLSYGINE